MTGKDILIMSRKEARRLYVLRKVLDGEIKQADAAGMLAMSTRQIRRIVKRIRDEGDEGVIHKLRGEESNRKTADKVKDKIIRIYRKKYKGFGPTLAAEKFHELDGVAIS
ncbi:MAG: ISNCY family transposase, partial [Nitrospira bacterium HGW-Nitrospira-1]